MVYEFLEGGGLVNLLNSEEGTKAFEWIKRVKLIKGVANALSYMQGQRHTWSVGGNGSPKLKKKKKY